MSDLPSPPRLGVFGANALAELANLDPSAYTAVLAGLAHGLVDRRSLMPGRAAKLVDIAGDLIERLVADGLDPSSEDITRWQREISRQVMGDQDDAAADLVAADDSKHPPEPSPI